MQILLQTANANGDEWRRAFVEALPEATVRMWPDVPPQADYLVVWKPAAEVFVKAPPVKAIFNLGAGVDAVVGVPSLPRATPLVRLEDAGMADQMADYVTQAVLNAYREQAAYAAQQRDALWRQRPYVPKRSFGVGILGLGLLGQAVAAALAPYGFPLLGWSRDRKTVAGVESYAGDGELPSFLTRTRVLVCLLPSTPQTRDLLDRERLMQLPRGAFLVNIARGELVVDADLISVLDAGHLAGATLDVFREEPLPPGHPFWHHPRITLTPHVAAGTLVEESVAQIAAKIRRLEQGLSISGVVDRARGY